MKKNKDECTLLLEQTLVILHAIVTICVNSDTLGILSPSMLSHIGDFILYYSSNAVEQLFTDYIQDPAQDPYIC